MRTKPKQWTIAQKLEMVEARRNGLNLTEVASLYGAAPTSIAEERRRQRRYLLMSLPTRTGVKLSRSPRAISSSLRLPPALILGIIGAGLVVTARHAKLDEFLAFIGQEGLSRLVPPWWAMSARAAVSHAIHAAELAWLTFTFAGSGRAVSERFQIRYANSWEAAAFWFAVGTGLWANLFLGLGFARLLYRPLLVGLIAAGSIGALWAWRRPTGAESGSSARISFASPWAILLVLHLLFLLPYVFVPETFYDSLEYHLGLPNLYLTAHRIGPTPDNSFSGVPSVPSMLFGWALAIDPMGIVAHLLSFSFLIWTAAGLFGLALRLNAPEAGLIGSTLFAAAPVVMTTSIFSTVELSWAFYQLLCFPALLSIRESLPDSLERRQWLFIGGACLGLAMTTKYLAWALPFAVTVFFLGARKEAENQRVSIREVGVVFAAAAFILAPWLLKNLVFYRNPVFPFFHEWWNPGSEVMPGWRYLGSGATLDIKTFGSWEYFRSYLAVPWQMAYYDALPPDSLGTVLLPLLPLIFTVRSSPSQRLLAYFAVAAWLPLSFVVRLPRYYIPVIPLFGLLVALRLNQIELPWLRRSLTAMALIAIVAEGLASWRWNFPANRMEAFTGQESADQMLRHENPYYPAPLYAAAQYVDAHAPPDAKVLVFGDSRGFYLQRNHITSTPQQVTILERWANSSMTGQELKTRFDGEGVTYIIVSHGEIVRQGLALHFTARGLSVLEDFWKRFTLKEFQFDPKLPMDDQSGILHTNRMVVVYKVLSNSAAALPHPSDDLFADYNLSSSAAAK